MTTLSPGTRRVRTPQHSSQPVATECVQSDADRSSWSYVRAIQSGDRGAFAELYRRYHRDVHGYLVARTKSVTLADDLTSETFLRALRGIDSVQERSDNARAWIMTIARNLAFDHHRSARHRLEDLSGEIGEAEVAASAEHDALRTITLAPVRHAISRLTAPQRLCLFLRFYCGYSVAHTAGVMDSNPAAVRALQHRATRALAATLTGPPRHAHAVR